MEWGVDAAASVEMKSHFKRTLKLVASVARRTDIPDYDTALLLVNTQAVRRLMECKNQYARRRYITSDDWLQVQELPVPSRHLTLDELAVARVHLDQFGEICAGAPFLPVVSPAPGPSSVAAVVAAPAVGDLAPVPAPAVGDLGPVTRRDSGRGLGVGAVEAVIRHALGSDISLPPGPSPAMGCSGSGNCEEAVDSLAGINNWLRCEDCGDLDERWSEYVACEEVLNLVGAMALLGVYFYTKTRICDAHLPLLAPLRSFVVGWMRCGGTRCHS